MKNRKRRYSGITAHPDTEAERDRIDALARKVDERWEAARAARGGMTDQEARAFAESKGWKVRRDHTCNRSPKRRATCIRVSCQVWTKVRMHRIAGIPFQCLDDGVSSGTWEKVFKLARCRVKLSELDARARKAVRR